MQKLLFFSSSITLPVIKAMRVRRYFIKLLLGKLCSVTTLKIWQIMYSFCLYKYQTCGFKIIKCRKVLCIYCSLPNVIILKDNITKREGEKPLCFAVHHSTNIFKRYHYISPRWYELLLQIKGTRRGGGLNGGKKKR